MEIENRLYHNPISHFSDSSAPTRRTSNSVRFVCADEAYVELGFVFELSGYVRACRRLLQGDPVHTFARVLGS